MSHFPRLANALFVAFALSACTGGGGNLPTASAQGSASANLGIKSFQSATNRKSAASSVLYVLNYTGSAAAVNVYNQNGKLVRTIPVTTENPSQVDLTTSANGLLYISCVLSKKSNCLNIYNNQGKTLVRTLKQRPNYAGVVADFVGNLYTQCKNGIMCEYENSKKHIVRAFADYSAPAATDAAGDVALTTFNTNDHQYEVHVFKPGAMTPYWSVPTADARFTSNIAFDAAGNLYIMAGARNETTNGSVTEFAPGATTPTVTIAAPNPLSIALDTSNNLFVLNRQYNQTPSVTEYAQGSASAIRTITDGIVGSVPQALDVTIAVDSQGNLYVANQGQNPGSSGNITVYSPGATSPTRTITAAIDDPMGLAI